MRLSHQFPSAFGSLTLSVFAWAWMPAAHAQLSGSAGLLSDYLYRGISLSSDKPVARLAVNYDASAGWYAGGQLLNGQLAGEPHRRAQWTGYAGYAQRFVSGLAWEAGVTSYLFPQQSSWNFRELYAGLTGDSFNTRLHYSPDYLGLGQRTVFAELNSGAMLGERVQGIWHVGYLYAPDQAQTNRAEARIGVVSFYQQWRAQLSLDAVRLRPAASPTIYSAASGTSAWQHKFVLAFERSF